VRVETVEPLKVPRDCTGDESRAGDMLAVAISGVGRRHALPDAAQDEVAALLAALPHGTQQIGFYSYGAIAPWAGADRPDGESGSLHLQHATMQLTTLAEA